MHIQKITFTLLFAVAALAGNAQENKKKTQVPAETTQAAPTQTVEEKPHKGAPIPTSADAPQSDVAPQAAPAPTQPMQAVPQTTTSGDKPVEEGKMKQPIDRTVKRNLKAKNAQEQPKK